MTNLYKRAFVAKRRKKNKSKNIDYFFVTFRPEYQAFISKKKKKENR